MERREDEMSRERGLSSRIGRIEISDLPYHDDIRILSQECFEPAVISISIFFIHLRLDDPREFILDRIFERDHLTIFGIKILHHGVKGRRLP